MIKPLTSLRYFFSMMVFFHHCTFLRTAQPSAWNSLYDYLFSEPYVWVAMFFVLSGYVMCHSYYDKLSSGTVSSKTYWFARIARIYPLHLLTLILAFPLTIKDLLHNTVLWCFQFLTNLTLVQSFFLNRDIYFSFNYASWSISDEAFFYLVFPLIVLFIFRANKYVVISAFTIIMFGLLVLQHFYPFDQIQYGPYNVFPLVRLCDFSLGISIYFLSRHLPKNLFRTTRIATFFEILSIFIFACFVGFHLYVPYILRFSPYYWLPMAVLIFTFSYQSGYISKMISYPFFILLGEISFGLYLFHQIILRYYAYFYLRYHFPIPYFVQIILLLAFATFISYLGHKYFEMPMNKKVKAYLNKTFAN